MIFFSDLKINLMNLLIMNMVLHGNKLRTLKGRKMVTGASGPLLIVSVFLLLPSSVLSVLFIFGIHLHYSVSLDVTLRRNLDILIFPVQCSSYLTIFRDKVDILVTATPMCEGLCSLLTTSIHLPLPKFITDSNDPMTKIL